MKPNSLVFIFIRSCQVLFDMAHNLGSSSVSKSCIGREIKGNVNATLISDLKRKCIDMCGFERDGFPGSQPVSMSMKNIDKINRIPYVVCEKSDGERHLLLADDHGDVYFVNRQFAFYKVNFKLPLAVPSSSSSDSSSSTPQYLTNTLLDGELVEDKDPNITVTSNNNNHEKGPMVVRYLVYDAVYMNGDDVKNENLLSRLMRVSKGGSYPLLGSIAGY
jgi:hypothetical protein